MARKSDHFHADVLVLGAGIAGLNAARDLSEQHRVIVLEATERVGGRIHSVRGDGPISIELGAEFVHGKAPALFDLLRRTSLVPYELSEKHVESRNGKIVDTDDDWNAGMALLDQFGRAGSKDMSFAQFVERDARKLSASAKQRAVAFVEGFNAADQTLISVQSLKRAAEAEDRIDGERQHRLIGAYDDVPKALAHEIREPSRIDLQTRVTRIAWRKQHVTVEAQTPAGVATYTARGVVIALPLGVLQSDRIAFDPPLPTRKVLDQLAMGPVVKALVRFRTPFWHDMGQEDLSFVHDLAQPFPTWWTTHPLRTPLLTGWCGGAPAGRLPADDAALRGLAIESLSHIFARKPRDVGREIDVIHIRDWRRDEHTLGAYAYVKVGGVDAPAKLARPIQQTLFMAGEHTDLEMIGTVAGALASGERAARQAHRELAR